MDLMSDPIVEMEEWLSQDVPCGGNNFPVDRPCPRSDAARFVKAHSTCGLEPQSFKCTFCLMEWMQGSSSIYCSCFHCGYEGLKCDAYRLL